jgi:tetratricopeptide (TPR) repeat protein
LQERRRVLHARIVEALEALAGEQVAEQVERLAHHALRGEVWHKALAYFQRAGEKAMAQSAYGAAVGYFEQALSALQQLPETQDTPEQAIDLRLALRSALLPSGDFERILAYLREAEALATALDDPRRLAQVSRFLTDHFRLIGAYDQAIATAQRTLALATVDGEVIRHAVHWYLGEVYAAQGDYHRALDYMGQAAAFFDGARRHERFGHVILPAVLSRTGLAWCHAELGTFSEGRALGEEGLRIAEAAAHPASLMYACWGGGLLALRQGEVSRALSLLERALSLCQEVAFSVYFPMMAATLGEVYTLCERITDAVPLLTQTIKQSTAMENVYFETFCRVSMSTAQILAGHLEEAHTLAERVLAFTRAHQERGHQAYALRLLGEIAARREPPECAQAEAHYQQALVLAEELGMRPLAAHCHRGIGMLYAATGQREQARTELSTAIEMYKSMEMTFWLPQTEAALTQVEGR